MRDFFTLDQTPCDEPCASVGEPDYDEKALAQCRRFIGLLRQTFGLEPDGTRLSIKSFPHDFGTYYSVVCYFSHGIPASAAYARRCEDDAPTTWEGINRDSQRTTAIPTQRRR